MTQRDYERRYNARIHLDGVAPFDALTPEQESNVVQDLRSEFKKVWAGVQELKQITSTNSMDAPAVSAILFELCKNPLLSEYAVIEMYRADYENGESLNQIESTIKALIDIIVSIRQKIQEDNERLQDMRQELQKNNRACESAATEARQTEGKEATTEAPASQWEKLVKNSKLIVDYSSLISQGGEQLFVYITPLLEQYDKKLNIPKATICLMQQEIQNNASEEARQYVAGCYQHLLELQQQGRVLVCEFPMAEDVNLAEEECREIKQLAAKHRMIDKLLVLTQNTYLAEELMKLSEQPSASGKQIWVKKLNRNGIPVNLINKPIKVATEPRVEPDSQLPLTELPTVGSPVYTEHGTLYLQSVIGEGGEGCVYRTESSYVAKIYKPECCTAYRLEKLQKMLEANLKYEGICFPVELLKNSKGEFVGYLMEEAPAKYTLKNILGPAKVKRNCPDLTRLDMIRYSLKILEKFQYLHSQNIVLCDINPKNILIADPEHVYFVDTDSYQINDLPCHVGMSEYTAPELHDKSRRGEFQNLSEVLRTKDHDNFAIATVLFQMMMGGKKPYSQPGECNSVDDILSMHFPYALGEEKRSENLPDGNWRFYWSHMDRKVKEAFKAVFDGSERTPDDPFNTKNRKDATEWIKVMDRYQNSLRLQWSDLNKFCEEQGCTWEDVEELSVKGCEVDPQRFTLFPNRYKRVDTREYAKCKNCGKEFSVEKGKKVHDLCFDCRKAKPRSQKELICDDCGEHFFISFEKYDLLANEGKAPKRCDTCKAKKNQRYDAKNQQNDALWALRKGSIYKPTGLAGKPNRKQPPVRPRIQPSAPAAANPATPPAKTEDGKKKSIFRIFFGR